MLPSSETANRQPRRCPIRHHKAAVAALATALLLIGLCGPAAAQRFPQPTTPEEVMGFIMHQAGLNIFVPAAFELSRVSLRGHEGPVELLVFEPQNGIWYGTPNAGFVTMSVYDFDIEPDEAVEVTLNNLRSTFRNDAGGIVAEPVELLFVGEARQGQRLTWQLAGVDLEGRIIGIRDENLTVVAFVQGRPTDFESLDPVFTRIFGDLSLGAPTEQPEDSGAMPVPHTDEGPDLPEDSADTPEASDTNALPDDEPRPDTGATADGSGSGPMNAVESSDDTTDSAAVSDEGTGSTAD